MAAKPRRVAMERINPACQLGKLLEWCRNESATDVHAHAGHPFTFRRDGRLTRIPAEAFPVPSDHDLVTRLREAFSRAVCERIKHEAEMDLSFLCGQVRSATTTPLRQPCRLPKRSHPGRHCPERPPTAHPHHRSVQRGGNADFRPTPDPASPKPAGHRGHCPSLREPLESPRDGTARIRIPNRWKNDIAAFRANA